MRTDIKTIEMSSITTIRKYVFIFCENLYEITIPYSVSEIGEFSFLVIESYQLLSLKI
jgi:hypothetical protein